MKTSDYWNKRYLEIKSQSLENSENYERDSYKRLDGVLVDFNEAIKSFINRYSNDGKIDKTDATKLLRGLELNQWKYSLDEWERMAKVGGYDKQMNIEYYRSRISRLEALEFQLKMIMADYVTDESTRFEQVLLDDYESTYYRNIYTQQQQFGSVGSNFAVLNERQLKQIVKQKWRGSDFSSRLWGNAVNDLPEMLSKTLLRGVSLGSSINDMVRINKKQFKNFKEYQLHRLINTEFGHIAERATLDSYKETGVEQYKYLATLESHTCDVCAKLDGEIYSIKDKKDGINYPLIHPNCRCTTVPYYEAVKADKRWSRNPNTGKSEIIDDMTFKQWSDKVGLFTERDFGKGFVDMKSHIKGKTSAKLYKDTINRTRKMANEEPAIRNYVAKHGLKVGFEDDIDTSYAVTEWGKNYPMMEINYNNKRFGRKNIHRKAIEGDIDAGWLMNVPKNQALNYMPTHEMGHVLHNVLFEKYNPDLPNTKAYRNDWIDGVFDKVYNEAIKKTGMTSRELNDLFVSGYGRHNKREWFAEMYAEMKLSDGNPMTEAFKKVLREL